LLVNTGYKYLLKEKLNKIEKKENEAKKHLKNVISFNIEEITIEEIEVDDQLEVDDAEVEDEEEKFLIENIFLEE
jgi:hypothetical protein